MWHAQPQKLQGILEDTLNVVITNENGKRLVHVSPYETFEKAEAFANALNTVFDIDEDWQPTDFHWEPLKRSTK